MVGKIVFEREKFFFDRIFFDFLDLFILLNEKQVLLYNDLIQLINFNVFVE